MPENHARDGAENIPPFEPGEIVRIQDWVRWRVLSRTIEGGVVLERALPQGGFNRSIIMPETDLCRVASGSAASGALPTAPHALVGRQVRRIGFPGLLQVLSVDGELVTCASADDDLAKPVVLPFSELAFVPQSQPHDVPPALNKALRDVRLRALEYRRKTDNEEGAAWESFNLALGVLISAAKDDLVVVSCGLPDLASAAQTAPEPDRPSADLDTVNRRMDEITARMAADDAPAAPEPEPTFAVGDVVRLKGGIGPRMLVCDVRYPPATKFGIVRCAWFDTLHHSQTEDFPTDVLDVAHG